MNPAPTPLTPGACYKFKVKSAEEAATLIRERLGPTARVLSVRSVEPDGLKRLWSAPSLEVVAQLDAAPAAPKEPLSEPEEEYEEAQPRQLAREEASAQPAPALEPAVSKPRAQGASVFRKSRSTPTLPELLRRSGLSELALGRLQEMPTWEQLLQAPLHRALVEVGRHLQEESGQRWERTPLSRAAFLGTPGSGRTTALCKWLGAEVFRRARMGHVVTAEFDRPNPPGSLPVFCEALGVHVARYPALTQPTVPGGFVYFDLPGMSISDPESNGLIEAFLDREEIEQRILVLNAAYDHSALRSTYALGRSLGATHLVFTHLDEVPQWGRLWDYLLDGALEPLFLASGPSLTGDCEEEVFGSLVRRTLAGNPQEPREQESTENLMAASDRS